MINRAFIVKYRNKKTQRRKSTKWSSFRKERKKHSSTKWHLWLFTEMHSLRKSFCGRISSLVYCQTWSQIQKSRKKDNDKMFFDREWQSCIAVLSSFFSIELDLAVSSWTKFQAYYFFSIVFLPNVTLVITVTIDCKCHELLKLRTFFERDMICACIIHIFQANMYVMDDMPTLLLLLFLHSLVSSWDICCTVKQVHVLYTQAHPTTHIRRFLSTSAVI